MMSIRVVFLGHGTRQSRGTEEFYQFIQQVQERVVRRLTSLRGQVSVTFTHGFLEWIQPDLASALRACHVDGMQNVILCPLFLFDAGHMKKDIPAVVEGARSFIKNSSIETLPAVGLDENFVDVVVNRLQQAKLSPDHDAVLLLGRGNKDAAAQATFENLARHIQQRGNVGRLEAGYLTGTGRDWREALGELAVSGVSRAYIQPYLFFHGWLTEQLPLWVADWKSSQMTRGSMQVQIGQPLGPDSILAESITERIVAAVIQSKLTLRRK